MDTATTEALAAIIKGLRRSGAISEYHVEGISSALIERGDELVVSGQPADAEDLKRLALTLGCRADE